MSLKSMILFTNHKRHSYLSRWPVVPKYGRARTTGGLLGMQTLCHPGPGQELLRGTWQLHYHNRVQGKVKSLRYIWSKRNYPTQIHQTTFLTVQTERIAYK